MRSLTTVWIVGVALASLAACNRPSQGSSGASAPESAIAATTSAGPVGAQDVPHRKAGLWRQTMAVEGMAQALPTTSMCVDAASEAKMSMLGQQAASDCQTPRMSRGADGSIRFNSICGKGKTVSSGIITGDFNNSYKMVVDTTTADGKSKMTIAATRTGPCAADQKGGDVISNGRKINVIDMMSKRTHWVMSTKCLTQRRMQAMITKPRKLSAVLS